ncbi:regulatory protein Spx [mine drainage metagenome]|uniref:Regulatory protein Spx n=1 Tax=mine drainage metagenome TaxID=410659 RepID=A0A1J5RV13_9ZZZZ
MLTVYGIPNCNTVKKARTWLDEHGVAYTFHDFKKLGIDEATLNLWLTQQPWEKLINRAGLTWRGLSDEAKAAITDNASANALMQAKTSVIKRPLLVRNQEQGQQILALGFSETEYAKIFAPVTHA